MASSKIGDHGSAFGITAGSCPFHLAMFAESLAGASGKFQGDTADMSCGVLGRLTRPPICVGISTLR
jgi:hypothetical protein